MNRQNDCDRQQGLYRSEYEHDACGVGMVANLSGEASHGIVANGLTILKRLMHRGATGNDPETGDGAGLLLKIPQRFFQKKLEVGIGMCFLCYLPTHILINSNIIHLTRYMSFGALRRCGKPHNNCGCPLDKFFYLTLCELMEGICVVLERAEMGKAVNLIADNVLKLHTKFLVSVHNAAELAVRHHNSFVCALLIHKEYHIIRHNIEPFVAIG